MRVFVVLFKWIAGIALISVLFMISGIFSGPSADAGLSNCPPLQEGQADPIDGKDCVRMLQQKLRDSGYLSQQVNGKFGPLTIANVVAFQKAAGLRPDGKVGPQTFAALTGNSTPTPPELNLSTLYCSNNICHFVVPQGATHQVGNWLADHPNLAKNASLELLAHGVCGATRISAKIARLACEKLAKKEIGDFIATLKSAARKNACVWIFVNLPGGGNLEFLRFTSMPCRS